MLKILSSLTLLTLFTLTLGACSGRSLTEQRQTTQVEQYSSDNAGQHRQCSHSVVIQNNDKTEIHQSSKC